MVGFDHTRVDTMVIACWRFKWFIMLLVLPPVDLITCLHALQTVKSLEFSTDPSAKVSKYFQTSLLKGRGTVLCSWVTGLVRLQEFRLWKDQIHASTSWESKFSSHRLITFLSGLNTEPVLPHWSGIQINRQLSSEKKHHRFLFLEKKANKKSEASRSQCDLISIAMCSNLNLQKVLSQLVNVQIVTRSNLRKNDINTNLLARLARSRLRVELWTIYMLIGSHTGVSWRYWPRGYLYSGQRTHNKVWPCWRFLFIHVLRCGGGGKWVDWLWGCHGLTVEYVHHGVNTGVRRRKDYIYKWKHKECTNCMQLG